MDLVSLTHSFLTMLSPLRFGLPVTHVYNPLEYALNNYETYLRSFAATPKQVVFLGMNPGPWGMAQTGIPFGDPERVKSWMGIQGPVDKPEDEHPLRPVLGVCSPRREVSGSRLWGMISTLFATPELFFQDHFVANYCPFCFLEATGRNRTPDKLPASERTPLFAACDWYLQQTVTWLAAKQVIGIGAFAAERARKALSPHSVFVGELLHPSPASPKANAGWSQKAIAQLHDMQIWLSLDISNRPMT